MSRSRALNRFNRLNAKRRRRALRIEVPILQEGFLNRLVPGVDVHALRQKACYKENMLEFIDEPQSVI